MAVFQELVPRSGKATKRGRQRDTEASRDVLCLVDGAHSSVAARPAHGEAVMVRRGLRRLLLVSSRLDLPFLPKASGADAFVLGRAMAMAMIGRSVRIISRDYGQRYDQMQIDATSLSDVLSSMQCPTREDDALPKSRASCSALSTKIQHPPTPPAKKGASGHRRLGCHVVLWRQGFRALCQSATLAGKRVCSSCTPRLFVLLEGCVHIGARAAGETARDTRRDGRQWKLPAPLHDLPVPDVARPADVMTRSGWLCSGLLC